MTNPIGTYKAGELIALIKVYLKGYTEEVFPKKAILMEINLQLSELQGLQATTHETEYGDSFPISSVSDTISLPSVYANYKSIDRITEIRFDDDRLLMKGLCIELPEREFETIKNNIDLSNYSESIIWTRKGDILYFKKPTSILYYGLRTVSFRRIPIKLLTYADFIDIKDTDLNILKNKVKNALMGVTDQSDNKIPTTVQSEVAEKQKNKTIN